MVVLSSAKFEFKGIAKGMCKILWLERLMINIGCALKIKMSLFCDNKAAIDISHNPISHDSSKHIEVD